MFRPHVKRAISFAALACAVVAMGQDTPLVSAQRPALEKLTRWVGVWEGTYVIAGRRNHRFSKAML